jgi:pimeloyl-ACP methyl ester carboxylesterase
VDDVISVMDGTGITRAHVVGLSRGAITAFGLASRFPERTRKLVLAFPVAGFADTIGIEGETGCGGDEEGLEGLALLDRALDTTFSAEFLGVNRQACRNLFLSPPGTAVRVERPEEATLGPNETVTTATLIVSGGRDQVVAPEHPTRLKVAIPGAETFEFPEAMHGFVMEQPESFADVVVPFLNR